jgi:hypothetical protein
MFSFWKEAAELAMSEGFSALRAIDEAGNSSSRFVLVF